MPSSLHRIRRLRAALPDGMPIQVDGGIVEGNIRDAFEAGATLFVGGNAIFGNEDPTRSYRQLVQALA
jgi:ribulose-phosphate 3-epimerase